VTLGAGDQPATPAANPASPSYDPAAPPATPDPANPARPPLLVVVGPTAVGKTALAVDLARRFGGEVVNADSRYLYRGFEIGVAKPSPAERAAVPHHLIDVLPPDGDVSLARYQDLGMAAIAAVHARGKLPILVGGTPLYVNAVVEGWRIPRVPPNPAFRAALEAEAAAHGPDLLTERLRQVDPTTAARSGRNLRRVIRALEIHAATGTPMSAQEGKGPPPFAALEIALAMPRDQLYQRIDARVDDQIARGLVDEVRALLAAGVPPTAPAMTSLGYRQLLPALRGEIPLPEAIAQIKRDTHRYVRHQETWLRRNPRLLRVDVSTPGWTENVVAAVAAFLAQHPRAPIPAELTVG
jgi:tRNA dimethylallyltransferase